MRPLNKLTNKLATK